MTGQFDAILSVEMIEAVAERYWPAYFAALDRLLAPGGRVGLQSITMAARPDAGHPAHPDLDPEVHLPRRADPVGDRHRGEPAPRTPACGSPAGTTSAALRADAADLAGAVRRPGGRAAGPLGFDDVFRRMWQLYLCYSEAGFRSGYLHVSQFLLTRAEGRRPARGVGGRPRSRCRRGRMTATRRPAATSRPTATRPREPGLRLGYRGRLASLGLTLVATAAVSAAFLLVVFFRRPAGRALQRR